MRVKISGKGGLCIKVWGFDLSGGSMISGKGVHIYKGVGVRFADFISFVLNIP